jgi:hypothetical protein
MLFPAEEHMGKDVVVCGNCTGGSKGATQPQWLEPINFARRYWGARLVRVHLRVTCSNQILDAVSLRLLPIIIRE